MKWLNNIKISIKLLGSFTIIALLSGLVGVVGIVNIRNIDAADTKLYEQITIPIAQIGEMSTHFQRMRANYRDVLLTEKLQRPELKKLINERIKEINRLSLEYEKTILTKEGRDTFNVFKKEYKKYTELADQAFELALLGKDKEALAIFDGDAGKVRKIVQNEIEVLFKNKINLAKQISDDNTAMANRASFVMMIIIASAIVLGLILGFIISRSISSAVNKGLGFAGKIAAGDLSSRIDLNQEDELGQLGKALNSAADNLEEMVSNVIVASQNLSQAVDQIASGNQNLSQRTSEQASSLEEIASTIEETTATINQNADNAIQANRQTEISSKLAQDGGILVGEAVASINEINQTSKKIGEIINVINEISFQTNLLALNAAVEAARAGEQGRGFAVVAGEVRNLAQRSGSAAKEIGTLIKDSIEKIELGTSKANKSGEAINEIIESVKGVVKVMAEISAASTEQKQGINQINIAITEMDTMTQQNAALVEETASASEEMANQAQELLAMMQKFIIRNSMKNEVALKHKEIHLHTNDKSESNIKKAEKKYDKSRDKDGFIKIESTANKKKDIKSVLSAEGFEEF